ncbi:EAL domain-containing protein [Pullulanibacillus sp. KACC 23026]|uniref:EAL domain-containing protein n=1 Tax=Pullulanibacillus sp. KACC 23026 TaxID=3028315 RepID=UPI0023B02DC8|nr:EAL domain-containing protein [Pullulanibacillus sp. KACC 23026]WEG14768.1 EAL domain-containing protein [Pullulanibacillus sp. KACC 23026]
MLTIFINLMGQTWLVCAQIFSTREFAQLAIERLLPNLSTWFMIVSLPVGLAIDATFLHFSLSVGVMGILYVMTFVLKSKPLEPVGFGLSLLLSLLGMDLYQYGMTAYTWESAFFLILFMLITTFILTKKNRLIGIVWSLMLSAVMELLTGFVYHFRLDCLAVTLMTAVMSGLYVTYRSLHEKQVKDTSEAVLYDSLTNALTRRGLQAWLESSRSRGDDKGIIVFCDLDNFKWINDTWGHEAGDQVLIEFVKRISHGLRTCDTIARFGGDEYQLWLPMKEIGAAKAIVERLHVLATQTPYKVTPDETELKIGVSMGWTFGEFTQERANDADFALLEAKRLGKNRICELSDSDTTTRTKSFRGDEDPHLYWLKNIAQSLWSDAHYPFVLTDKTGRILFANNAYEFLVGKSLAELLGNKPGMNSAMKTPPAVYSNMWSHLSNGLPWSGCLLNRREDGNEWWEISELFPIKLSGQIIGYWGLVQELTQAKFPPSPIPTDYNYKWHGDIDWAFQPIIDVNAHSTMGYEALARPRWGEVDVMPDTFFKIAESFNFRINVDWDCLESLLDKLKTIAWPEETRLFVNIYAETFKDQKRLKEWLTRFFSQHPTTICVLEILERDVHTIERKQWKDIQKEFPLVELAQDDFGNGEQDLIRLIETKPNWLKLDREWVNTLSIHPESQFLMSSIAAWVRAEGIKLIIEGIETGEQSKAYKDMGIYYEQGYYWSKPIKDLDLATCSV